MVNDAWVSYLDHHQKRWSERHYKDHLNLSQKGGEPMKRGKKLTVQGVIYPLLQMRMVDINADSLKEWLIKEAGIRPNNARQGFELFRAFWRWCGEHRDYKEIVDVAVVDNKELRKELPARKNKQFDVLERGQIKVWFESVRELSNPVISAYLQALILTGARREEMAELKWENVDFKWSAPWIKDKVHEEDRKVPLTPQNFFSICHTEWQLPGSASILQTGFQQDVCFCINPIPNQARQPKIQILLPIFL